MQRRGIVVHEDAIIAGRDYVSRWLACKVYAPHNSLALLSTTEEDIAEALVCHCLRDRTRASISVLIVG